MCTFRIVECPSCGGDGYLYFGHPNDPSPPSTLCTNCHGECVVVIDVERCTDEDLDELDELGALPGEAVPRLILP